MRDAQPRSIRLADYRPPMYLVPRTALHFELYESFTLVHATLQLVRNPAGEQRGPLRLDGEGLELRELLIDLVSAGRCPKYSKLRSPRCNQLLALHPLCQFGSVCLDCVDQRAARLAVDGFYFLERWNLEAAPPLTAQLFAFPSPPELPHCEARA